MIFFIFILWFLLAESIVVGTRYLLLRKFKFSWWYDLIVFFVELLASIVIAYLTMATEVGISRFGSFLFGLYIALFADSFAHLIYTFVQLYFKNSKRFITITSISNVLAIGFMIFGMVNMSVVSQKQLEYSSSKLTNTYKIAFISDLHVGMAQTMDRTLKTINEIKDQNPDFTIIGGDLVDEYATMDNMKTAVKAFGEFSTPVYFVHGNHELSGAITIDDLETELINNGIKIVKDEFVSISDDLTLLGREDLNSPNRKKVEELSNPYPSSYLLVADHQPFDFDNNSKLGVDLQLSGHTHAGQLFPLRLIYSLAVYSYGEYHYNNSILNVSSGASGWQNPIRTDVGCQYEIITLKPTF